MSETDIETLAEERRNKVKQRWLKMGMTVDMQVSISLVIMKTRDIICNLVCCVIFIDNVFFDLSIEPDWHVMA